MVSQCVFPRGSGGRKRAGAGLPEAAPLQGSVKGRDPDSPRQAVGGEGGHRGQAA